MHSAVAYESMQAPSSRLQLVNVDPRYPKPKLIPPTNHGYIYVAAAVRPGSMPLVLPSTKRSMLRARVKTLASQLALKESVVSIDAFGAIVIPQTA